MERDTCKQMCAFQTRKKWQEGHKREKEKEIYTRTVFLKKKLYTEAEVPDSLEDSWVMNCLKQGNTHRCFSALCRSVCL